MKKYSKMILAVVSVVAVAVIAVYAKSTKTESSYCGVTKLVVGKPEKFSVLDASNTQPNKEALEKMPKAKLPIAFSDVAIRVADGKTYIRFPLERGEKIYGLGLNFKKVDQRGTIRRLQMDIYQNKDDGRTHAPIPFFVSSRGYGVLINSARELEIYCGQSRLLESPEAEEEQDRATSKNWHANPYSDCMEIIVPKDGAELLFFAGNNPAEVVQRYNLFSGGGFLPSRDSLGFWHRVPLKFTSVEALSEVDELQKRGFPISVLGLEPGWHSASYPCSYEWSKERFPDPKGFLAGLEKRNVRVNLWMNAYVSKKSPIYNDLKKYFADHTVWCGAVPDYSMPEVRKIFADYFKKEHIDIGVGGFKLDENDGCDEWLYPDCTIFPSGIGGEQFRQTHAVFISRMIRDLYENAGRRTFGLVRGANAGFSSYPFVLYSDYSNARDIITAAVNSSFIGVLWTPEACNARNADEWSKRIQANIWSPLAMLNAWSSKKKPWSFAEVEDDVRQAFELRMKLVPYIYNAFAKYAFEGIPPVRAMVLESSFDTLLKDSADKLSDEYKTLAKDVRDQWMFGDDILVAPMFAGEKSRKVLLPAGKWFNFYTGKYAGSAEVIEVDFAANGNKIPVFVRNGALIPMQKDSSANCRTLVIRHYGDIDGSLDFYDDDGKSFEYRKGSFTRCVIKASKNGLVDAVSSLPNFDTVEFRKM